MSVSAVRAHRRSIFVGMSLVGVVIATLLALAGIPIASGTSEYRASQASAYAGDASRTPSPVLHGTPTIGAHGVLMRWTPALIPRTISVVDIFSVRLADQRGYSAVRAAGLTGLRGYDAAAPPFQL